MPEQTLTWEQKFGNFVPKDPFTGQPVALTPDVRTQAEVRQKRWLLERAKRADGGVGYMDVGLDAADKAIQQAAMGGNRRRKGSSVSAFGQAFNLDTIGTY